MWNFERDTRIVNDNQLLKDCVENCKIEQPYGNMPEFQSHEEVTTQMRTVLQFLAFRFDLTYEQRIILEANVHECLRALRKFTNEKQ